MVNRIVNSININLTSISTDESISDVPCDSCVMCCKLLSPFLTPEEVASGKYPLSLLNPSNPNEGPTVVLFRNPEGGCGMLVNNKCSIYEYRPIACRQFDCRKGHHSSTNKVAKEKFGIDIS